MSTEQSQEMALCAVLRSTSAADWTVGVSRLAGAPDLPLDIAWPASADGRPLTFVAQLDLASLPEIELALPRQGRLWAFVDLDPYGSYEHRILFSEEESSRLMLRAPQEIEASFQTLARKPVFELRHSAEENETRIGGARPWSYPALHAAMHALGMGDAADYTSMTEKRFDEEVRGFLASVAEWAQAEGHRLDEVVRPKLDEYRRRRAEVEVCAATFRTLLVLGSEPDLDWCWGDAGEFHVLIAEDDLERRCFDRTFGWLESS